MLVDPYMRGRMNDGKSYVPQFEIGKPLEGGAVGAEMNTVSPSFSFAMENRPTHAVRPVTPSMPR